MRYNKTNDSEKRTRWSCFRVKLQQRENCQELQLSQHCHSTVTVSYVPNLMSSVSTQISNVKTPMHSVLTAKVPDNSPSAGA